MRTAVVLVVLFAAAIGLQAQIARQQALGLPAGVTGNLLYVRSPAFMSRAALSFDAFAADVYWIRTVQHYGSTKLATGTSKQYDLLYPLLDLTTSLDPYFDVAYRFGAVFLAEPYPSGAGRPDQAVALLQKGLQADPRNWQRAEDVGFVYYWWVRDYAKAADWFNRASDMPDAPNWLKPLVAVTLAQGGNRDSSRRLWMEVRDHAQFDWLRDQARFRLSQLDAMDEIAALERLIETYRVRTGSLPRTWIDLVRAGLLRGIPLDPASHVLQLDPATGTVMLAPDSPLNPLPAPERPA